MDIELYQLFYETKSETKEVDLPARPAQKRSSRAKLLYAHHSQRWL